METRNSALQFRDRQVALQATRPHDFARSMSCKYVLGVKKLPLPDWRALNEWEVDARLSTIELIQQVVGSQPDNWDTTFLEREVEKAVPSI